MTNNTETILQTACDLLTPWTVELLKPETGRMDIVLSRTNLLAAVGALVTAHWGYLSAITGLDHPGAPKSTDEKKEDEQKPPSDNKGIAAGTNSWLEVLYHFCHGPAIVTLRVRLSYLSPSVPSINNLIPSSGFYEQEVSEMFGIEVLGLPFEGHLLLPDDWPNGVYPLRKEFTGFNKSENKTEMGKSND